MKIYKNIYFCQNYPMEYSLEIFDKFAESQRKVWNKPVYEIISKEVIQSGNTPGVEGSVTATFHTHTGQS